MAWLIVAGVLLGGGVAAADGTAGAPPSDEAANAVYQYRDSAGVDHYVNHLELVPKGITSKRVDIQDQDLNPDLAREMTERAQDAAKEAKSAAVGEPVAPVTPPTEVPPEAHLVLIWAIAFTVVFAILWLSQGLLLMRSPSLAAAFQPIRWGTGAAAVLSWILLATLSRGWLVEHFDPLHSVKQRQISVDKINRQQRDAERALDKSP